MKVLKRKISYFYNSCNVFIYFIVSAQYRLSKNNQQPLIVCYVESWAIYRKAPLSFSSASLPPVCTHVLYAFATLHPETFSLMSNDREYDIIQGILCLFI